MSPIRLPADVRGIVPPEITGPVGAFAAEELQRYIRLATGRRIPIVPPTQCDGSSGWIRLLITGDSDDDHFEIIVDSDRHIITITGANPRSVLFGVYGFLRRFLGAHWLNPGPSAEVATHGENVEIPGTRWEERPLLRHRGFYVDTFQHSINANNIGEVVDWLVKNNGNYLLVSVVFFERIKTPLLDAIVPRGVKLEVGHHGFDHFVPATQHFAAHPDWFSLLNGKRSGGEFSGGQTIGTQLCASSAGALDAYVDALRRYLDANPQIAILGVVPNDGWGWCECTDCLGIEKNARLIPPDPDPFSSADRRPATGRYLHIVREVARRLERDLGRRRLSFVAYAGSLFPAETVSELPDHLIAAFALFQRWYDRPLDGPADPTEPKNPNPAFVDLLHHWRRLFHGDIWIYEYYAKYMWLSMPKWMPQLIRRETRLYATLGLQGLLSMMESDHYRVYEPNHLAQLAMSWSERIEADAWLEQYTQTVFGRRHARVRTAMEKAIDLMTPFAVLGPAYPRERVQQGQQGFAALTREYRALAEEAEGDGDAPASARLSAWAANAELTTDRFDLGTLYYRLLDAVQARRFADALALLAEWTALRERHWDRYHAAIGAGAVLGDDRWLGQNWLPGEPPNYLKYEKILEAALLAATDDTPTDAIAAKVQDLRYVAC